MFQHYGEKMYLLFLCHTLAFIGSNKDKLKIMPHENRVISFIDQHEIGVVLSKYSYEKCVAPIVILPGTINCGGAIHFFATTYG